MAVRTEQPQYISKKKQMMMRRGAMLDELISGVVLNAMTAGAGAGSVGKYAGRMIKVAKVGKYGGHVLGVGKR
jgi:hypothetical protein